MAVEADVFVKEARKEINQYFVELRKFHEESNVLEVLQKISAYSAYASFVASQCKKSNDPRVTQFLENELDVFLAEIQFQFKIYSRIQSVIQFDYDLTSKG